MIPFIFILPVVSAFHVSPLLVALSVHAFSSSFFRQIQEESILNEIELLSSNDFLNGISNFHFTSTWIHNSEISLVFVCIGLFGYSFYSSSSMQKLNYFVEYISLQKQIRLIFLVFLMIFFRNVENAI